MYLKEITISNLELFIYGFGVGFITGKNSTESDDYYFDDTKGFKNWFLKKKNITEVTFSSWDHPFLQEVNGDQKKALDLYFDYLEEYYLSQNKIKKK